MSGEELAKDIGPLAALTIGIGTMIGAGIFVLPGAAVERLGPLAAGAFVVGGAVAILTALSVSELGTAMPVSGGAYFYINRGLGPVFGSIAGWGNWVGLAFASAFYMYGFGEYVNTFVSAPAVSAGPLSLDPAQVIGLVGALLFIAVNYVGAKETGRLQNFIVVTLVLILTGFSVAGILNADIDSLTPPAPYGYTELLPVTGLVFVSYLGFVQITSVGEEIKDPGRNLPRAVVGSVLIVTAIYAFVLVVMLSAVPNDLVAGNDTAVVDAADLLIGPIGASVLLFGGLLATASSANASILASSRINFAMGREKIVSPALNDIHERFGTPYRSIALTGGLIMALIAAGNIEALAEAGSVLHLIIYGLVNIALIVFREADPEWYDPDFTVPLYPIVPITGSILSFALIAFMTSSIVVLAVLFVVGSVAWYLLYAREHVERRGVLADLILSRSEEFPNAAVSAATAAQPAGDRYRVMVPLANPAHQTELITLGSALAAEHDGTVVAVHIEKVPDQTTLAAARDRGDHRESQKLMQAAREDAETFGVDVETHTILSHRRFEELFDAARRYGADVTVLGWSEDAVRSSSRVEGMVEEFSQDLPCDFLIFRDRGMDPSRVLVPTAGGPNSDLSAAVAKTLQSQYDSEITLLHVAEDEREGTEFLSQWADEHGLDDATFRVESGDIEPAIERAAEDATIIVIGATERGVLSRLARRSPVLGVLRDVDCSVIIAEKRSRARLLEKLPWRSGPDDRDGVDD